MKAGMPFTRLPPRSQTAARAILLRSGGGAAFRARVDGVGQGTSPCATPRRELRAPRGNGAPRNLERGAPSSPRSGGRWSADAGLEGAEGGALGAVGAQQAVELARFRGVLDGEPEGAGDEGALGSAMLA